MNFVLRTNEVKEKKQTIKLLLKCAIIAKLFFYSVYRCFVYFFRSQIFQNKNKSVTSKLPKKNVMKNVKFGLYVFHERQISQLDTLQTRILLTFDEYKHTTSLTN